MKHFIKTTIITAGLSLTPLFAGAGHSHSEGGHHQQELEVSNIKDTAKQHLLQLIKDKKLDNSWSDISVEDAKKKQFGHHTEWAVSFKNSEVKDANKQTLYIFVSLHGKITGANFTGK